jgi:hypothetical protein
VAAELGPQLRAPRDAAEDAAVRAADLRRSPASELGAAAARLVAAGAALEPTPVVDTAAAEARALLDRAAAGAAVAAPHGPATGRPAAGPLHNLATMRAARRGGVVVGLEFTARAAADMGEDGAAEGMESFGGNRFNGTQQRRSQGG